MVNIIIEIKIDIRKVIAYHVIIFCENNVKQILNLPTSWDLNAKHIQNGISKSFWNQQNQVVIKTSNNEKEMWESFVIRASVWTL